VRADVLLVVTVGYLLLPNAVFAAGWLRPVWGYGVVLVLLACLVSVARRARTDASPLTALTRVFVAGLAAFWVAASGIGELTPQVADYVKHNLVFHDLAVEPWPVVYGAGERGGPMLCYYLAYYLPPALVAKLAGLQSAAVASLAWGAAGVALSFAWIARLGRSHGAAVLVLFTLIDGLCWTPGLVHLALRAATGAGAPAGGWWQTDGFTSRFWDLAGPQNRLVFQSEASLLIWTPQHALSAWLATACVLGVLWERRRPACAGLVNAAVVLWSPFVAVGLLPFTAAAVWRRGRPDVSPADLAGGAAMAVPVGLYFLAHEPQRYLGVLPAVLPNALAWAKYLLFLALAIGAVWGAVWLAQRRHALLDPARWLAFNLAGAALVASTFVTMGKYNDWAMRVSMPGLYVLHLTAAAVAVGLWRKRAPLGHLLALSALVLLTAVRPLKTYAFAPAGRLSGPGRQTTIATARAAARDLAHLRDGGDPTVAAQYLGSTASLFGRHLMREAPARGPGAAASTGRGGRKR
jgi:hypothetical protein